MPSPPSRRAAAKKELQLWQAENPGLEEEDVGSRHFADKLQVGRTGGGWAGVE